MSESPEQHVSSEKFGVLQWVSTIVALAWLIYLYRVRTLDGISNLFVLAFSLTFVVDWFWKRRNTPLLRTTLTLNPAAYEPKPIPKRRFKRTPLTWTGLALVVVSLAFLVSFRIRGFAVVAFASYCVLLLDQYVRWRSQRRHD
jgi:hypothetical protein